jgi:hypothetical protein
MVSEDVIHKPPPLPFTWEVAYSVVGVAAVVASTLARAKLPTKPQRSACQPEVVLVLPLALLKDVQVS